MRCHIEKIILWPREEGRAPRIVPLGGDRVKVVTGQSERGKSALLWIVDYCLGSRRCSIPVGLIREKTLWFGILLDCGSTTLLLARREPGVRAQTGAMFMEEGVHVRIPEQVSSNCTTADVRERLGQLAGLPSLEIDPVDGRSGLRARPSIRDLASFNFLPQHIVANPYTLFFKADTYEHQEKLKNVFPMVLGALDVRSLEWKRELKDVERELERARRDLDTKRNATTGWVSQLRSTYQQSQEFGLLPSTPLPSESWSVAEYVSRLTQVVQRITTGELPVVAEGATEEAVQRLSVIRDEELSVARRLASLRRKLSHVEQLDSSTESYAQTLRLREDRLEPVSWFAELVRSNDQCPMCGSTDAPVGDEVSRLVRVSELLGKSAAAIGPANRVLDRERAALQEDIRKLEHQLNDVRERRREWETTSDPQSPPRQTLTEIYRFVGRLEQALSTYRGAFDDRAATDRIRTLEGRADRLRKAVNPRQEQALTRAALEEISRLISIYAEQVGIDPSTPPARLDLVNLTLEFTHSGGRSDKLWEIGSAANWMGYHVATYLALHEFFLQFESSPVPSFLMIDQPSQAFFPDRWPGDPDPETGEVPIQDPVRSNDIERVRRIFDTLALARIRTDGRLQIIVVDHADEITWRGIAGVDRVARWRGDDALIPSDW